MILFRVSVPLLMIDPMAASSSVTQEATQDLTAYPSPASYSARAHAT